MYLQNDRIAIFGANGKVFNNGLEAIVRDVFNDNIGLEIVVFRDGCGEKKTSREYTSCIPFYLTDGHGIDKDFCVYIYMRGKYATRFPIRTGKEFRFIKMDDIPGAYVADIEEIIEEKHAATKQAKIDAFFTANASVDFWSKRATFYGAFGPPPLPPKPVKPPKPPLPPKPVTKPVVPPKPVMPLTPVLPLMPPPLPPKPKPPSPPPSPKPPSPLPPPKQTQPVPLKEGTICQTNGTDNRSSSYSLTDRESKMLCILSSGVLQRLLKH